MGRWMVEWMMGGWVDEWMNRLVGERINRQKRNRQMDGWQVDRWMGRQMKSMSPVTAASF